MEKHFFQLYGEFEYKLDPQKRVAVPAAWRTRNPSGHYTLIRVRGEILQLYPEQAFNERFGGVLANLRSGNVEEMHMARNFCSNCFTCVCDAQGRIALPKDQLEKVGIRSRIAMIGTGNFIQLMSGESRAAELAADAAQGRGDDYMQILDL